MKTTRRFFAAAILLAALPCLIINSSAKPKRPATSKYFALVGTYTAKTQSKGIYAYGFDPGTGKLTEAGVAAETPDPSFLVVHPNGKFVYAVNEGPVTDDAKHGAVTAFSMDPATGKLTQLNQVSSGGVDPCF